MQRPSAGFTLIELLVVISIIVLLASVIMAGLNEGRIRARDAARKQALHQIESALELYYLNNGSYPTTGATGPGSSAQWSTSTWIPALAGAGTISYVPRDPVNVDMGPWCWGGATTRNTIFTYASDGTHYVLCSWMENTSDPSTLQYRDVANPWSPANYLRANYSYSNYNYVIAK
jgi:prepilin-type N-terminal cleavage/methylation domain-containing protein